MNIQSATLGIEGGPPEAPSEAFAGLSSVTAEALAGLSSVTVGALAGFNSVTIGALAGFNSVTIGALAGLSSVTVAFIGCNSVTIPPAAVGLDPLEGRGGTALAAGA